MKIKIIAIGKTKGDFIAQELRQYLKRINHYTPLEWVEITLAPKSKNIPPELRLKKEAEKIRAKIPQQALKVFLSDQGEQFSSLTFAQWIEKLMIEGKPELVFVIGGDLGLHPGLIEGSDKCLSLSPMTFTHQMIRLILVEQLYRAFTIIRGEPYHHG